MSWYNVSFRGEEIAIILEAELAKIRGLRLFNDDDLYLQYADDHIEYASGEDILTTKSYFQVRKLKSVYHIVKVKWYTCFQVFLLWNLESLGHLRYESFGKYWEILFMFMIIFYEEVNKWN